MIAFIKNKNIVKYLFSPLSCEFKCEQANKMILRLSYVNPSSVIIFVYVHIYFAQYYPFSQNDVHLKS